MIHSLVRSTHILAGSFALIVGVVALVMAKGSDRHRAAGRAFAFSGRIVVVSALISSAWGVFALESRIGSGVDEAERAQILDVVPLFYGVLGVLGLMACLDLEKGLAALQSRRAPHLQPIAIAAGLAGLALSCWGIVRILDGRGGVSWFAVIVGWFGIETVLRNVIRTPKSKPRIETHASGMIDAMFGFVAAFALFGLGRLLSVDYFDGDLRVIVIVAVVVIAGHVVNRWWMARIRAGRVEPVRAPEPA